MKVVCPFLTVVGLFSLAVPSTGLAAERQVLPGHVPAAIAKFDLQPVDRLPATNHLQLAMALPLRDKKGLTSLLQQIYDPASSNYRHYLTAAQFAERFGPTAADYQMLTAFAASHHLAVSRTHPNRTLLDVEGSVADIESAFHIKMRVYRHPTEQRDFFAPDTEPSVDLNLPILHISGLDNFQVPHSMIVKQPPLSPSAGMTPASGSGPGSNYLGKDFRAAYVPGVTLTGIGQTVALVEFDSGYYQSDITNYESLAGLPNVPVSAVLVDDYDGGPGNGNAEVSLDIEMAISMAPGLAGVMVYEGVAADDILNQIATDDVAGQISSSWANYADAASDQIFQQYAAQGQSFFNACGDGDAWTGTIEPPCDDPNITVVGGTTLTTSGPDGAWIAETVWNWGYHLPDWFPGDSYWGSGGGISTVWSIPSWQTGINMATNLGSTTMRNLPDVALTANNVWITYGNGLSESYGGTSCAAPLWAAFIALVNQQAVASGNPTAGFINPALYALGNGTAYTSCFHDITTGNNTWTNSPNRFYAVTGYDLCTGWGTPNGSNLINALALPLPVTPASPGVTMYWNPGFNDTSPGSGGTGIWNASAADWWLNGSSNLAWSTGGDYAVFAGVAGTVTAGTSITADGVTFSTAGYTIAGTNQKTLALNGTTPVIWVPAGTPTSIACVLAGPGFEVTGGGVLVLENAGNCCGSITNPDYVNGPNTTLAVDTDLDMGSNGVTLNLENGGIYQDNDTNAGDDFLLPGCTVALLSGGGGFDNPNASLTMMDYITGPGSLTFTGVHGYTLTLTDASNNYSGGTIVKGPGTLEANAAGTLGAPSNPLTVSGGILNLGGAIHTVGAVTIYGGTVQNGTLSGASYAVSRGTVSAVLAGSGALVKTNSGTMTLGGANTYTGNTTLSAGVLALGGTGSISNSTAISIAAGATLDVSAISSFALSGNTTLSASGAGTTTGSTAATIKGGATVSLGSQPITLTFTPTAFNGDTAHPSLYISQGTLSLNGNAITVNNASGTALGAGAYLLIQQASGSVTSFGNNSVTVTGSGLVSIDSASIQCNGGNVNLVVAAPTPPVIQNVIQSGNSFAFTWSAITNQTYQIQSTTNLAPADWTNLGSSITANNATMTNSQAIGTNAQQFYRVLLLP